MMRAARTAHMQKPIEEMIVEIGRAAGDMAENILPTRRLSDLFEIVVALVGEEIFAKFDRRHAFVLSTRVRYAIRRAPLAAAA